MKLYELQKMDQFIRIVGKYEDETVSLVTDTRKIEDENIFLALKGVRFNGEEFIEEAIEKGIKNIILSEGGSFEKLVKKKEGVNFFLVKDSLKFLQEASYYWIRKWQEKFKGEVFSITGSNGKTTTKEILYTLAEGVLKDKVICTEGNLNNHIGVPLTILKIKEHHRFALIELGTSSTGEIEFLCNLANPQYGLITNIGDAHLEGLKSREGVYQEKTALFTYIEKYGKTFFINRNDEYLKNYPRTLKSFLIEEKKQCENKKIKEEYNLVNLEISFKSLKYIFPEKINLFKKIANELTISTKNRSQWITYKNKRIFLDAYNANPSSMEAAIRACEKQTKNNEKILYVIGDMNELGEKTEYFHENISKIMNELKIENAVFIGKFGHFYLNIFKGEGISYRTVQDFQISWEEVILSFDIIFLKASRTLQLESLIAKL